jgi:hypothetical protein
LLFSNSIINSPRKKGLKYTTIDKVCPVLDQYNKLLEVCRQTYVDIVGGSLLYSYARFSFSSTDAMIRYLDCINPAHRDAIQSINLFITASQPSHLLQNRALEVLATIPNLHTLTMDVGVGKSMCYTTRYSQVSLRRGYEMNAHSLHYLEKSRWDILKGLRRFEMTFCGTPRPRVLYGQVYHWHDDFDSVTEKQLDLVERIKGIVRRE